MSQGEALVRSTRTTRRHEHRQDLVADGKALDIVPDGLDDTGTIHARDKWPRSDPVAEIDHLVVCWIDGDRFQSNQDFARLNDARFAGRDGHQGLALCLRAVLMIRRCHTLDNLESVDLLSASQRLTWYLPASRSPPS